MSRESVPMRASKISRASEARARALEAKARELTELREKAKRQARAIQPKSHVKAPMAATAENVSSNDGGSRRRLTRGASVHAQRLEEKARRLMARHRKAEELRLKSLKASMAAAAAAAENVSSNDDGRRGGHSNRGVRERLREAKERETAMRFMEYRKMRETVTNRNKTNNNDSPSRSPNDGTGDEIPMIGMPDEQRKDHFETFLSAIKHWTSREYDHPLGIISLIEKLRDANSNTDRLYSLLWGQCTARLKLEIESDPEYAWKSNKKKTLWLFKKIQKLSSGIKKKSVDVSVPRNSQLHGKKQGADKTIGTEEGSKETTDNSDDNDNAGDDRDSQDVFDGNQPTQEDIAKIEEPVLEDHDAGETEEEEANDTEEDTVEETTEEDSSDVVAEHEAVHADGNEDDDQSPPSEKEFLAGEQSSGCGRDRRSTVGDAGVSFGNTILGNWVGKASCQRGRLVHLPLIDVFLYNNKPIANDIAYCPLFKQYCGARCGIRGADNARDLQAQVSFTVTAEDDSRPYSLYTMFDLIVQHKETRVRTQGTEHMEIYVFCREQKTHTETLTGERKTETPVEGKQFSTHARTIPFELGTLIADDVDDIPELVDDVDDARGERKEMLGRERYGFGTTLVLKDDSALGTSMPVCVIELLGGDVSGDAIKLFGDDVSDYVSSIRTRKSFTADKVFLALDEHRSETFHSLVAKHVRPNEDAPHNILVENVTVDNDGKVVQHDEEPEEPGSKEGAMGVTKDEDGRYQRFGEEHEEPGSKEGATAADDGKPLRSKEATSMNEDPADLQFLRQTSGVSKCHPETTCLEGFVKHQGCALAESVLHRNGVSDNEAFGLKLVAAFVKGRRPGVVLDNPGANRQEGMTDEDFVIQKFFGSFVVSRKRLVVETKQPWINLKGLGSKPGLEDPLVDDVDDDACDCNGHIVDDVDEAPEYKKRVVDDVGDERHHNEPIVYDDNNIEAKHGTDDNADGDDAMANDGKDDSQEALHGAEPEEEKYDENDDDDNRNDNIEYEDSNHGTGGDHDAQNNINDGDNQDAGGNRDAQIHIDRDTGSDQDTEDATKKGDEVCDDVVEPKTETVSPSVEGDRDTTTNEGTADPDEGNSGRPQWSEQTKKRNEYNPCYGGKEYAHQFLMGTKERDVRSTKMAATKVSKRFGTQKWPEVYRECERLHDVDVLGSIDPNMLTTEWERADLPRAHVVREKPYNKDQGKVCVDDYMEKKCVQTEETQVHTSTEALVNILVLFEKEKENGFVGSFDVSNGYSSVESLNHRDNQDSTTVQNSRNLRAEDTRRMDIRYTFIKDLMDKGEAPITCRPAENPFVAEFTKPLRGVLFRLFREVTKRWKCISMLSRASVPSHLTASEERVGKNASTVLDHECTETRELAMTCLWGLTGGWTVCQAAFDVMVVNDDEIVHSFETIQRDRR